MNLKGYFYIMSRQTGMVFDVDMAFECDQTYKPIVVRKLESEGEPKNQLWKYNIATGELESRMGGQKRLVLDVSGGYAHNNAGIINDTANGAPGQKWYFKPDGTLQSALGDQWVLEARETYGENKTILGDNTQVVLYDRETPLPSISQQWDAVPYVPTSQTGFYIRSSLHDLYLQIRENKSLCVGDKDKAQRWTYNKKTRNIEMVMEGEPRNSIEVADRVAVDRAKIIASPTDNDGLSRKWTFWKTGAIVSGLGGMQWVLDVRGSAGKGAEVILFTWHGKKNQQWYIDIPEK